MENLVGTTLINLNKRDTTQKLLNNKKIIGLFFTKYQCPACINFLSIINNIYKEINNIYDDFEIIYIPIYHHNEEDFNMYYKKMDFLSIPYSQKEICKTLKNKYNITSLPTLIFINKKGEIISDDGYSLINNLKNPIFIYDLLINSINK